MEIFPLEKKDVLAAADLFIAGFKTLRQAVPALPDRMEDPAEVSRLLERLLARSAGLAAYEGDRLFGYLGWWIVDGFRSTSRKAAYVPEWAHGASEDRKPATYRSLYRAAAETWAAKGCDTHAITLLTSEKEAIDTWFWNGFGLTVVDAARSTRPINPDGLQVISSHPEITLRKALPDDASALAELEREHARHYAQSPVFMVPFTPNDPGAFKKFLAAPENHAWLAFQEAQPVGYVRFEARSEGAAEIVFGPGSIACTAGYVRPACRGRGITPALLEAAIADFSSNGIQSCSVDFESFNPEAAAFWPRYFTSVCFSLVRVPEVTGSEMHQK